MCSIMLIVIDIVVIANIIITNRVKLKDILMIRHVTLVTQSSAVHDVSCMLRLQIEHLTFSGLINVVIIIIFLVIILILFPLIIIISYIILMTDHHYS